MSIELTDWDAAGIKDCLEVCLENHQGLQQSRASEFIELLTPKLAEPNPTLIYPGVEE